MDYGKIDYVVHDGKVVILDVNKTTARWRVEGPEGDRAPSQARTWRLFVPPGGAP